MKKTFVAIFLLIFCTLCAQVPSGYNEAQAEKWQKMETFVDLLRDGCGKPVDKKIKEMVTIINLFGIETSQSCEGHPKW